MTIRRSGESAIRHPRLVRAVDTVLEATIAGSFSRLGYEVRRRTQHWTAPPAMAGRVVVVTGASSGIGLTAATALGRLGAALWLVGRDEGRLQAAAGRAVAAGAPRADAAVVELTDAGAVAAFARRVTDHEPRLDGLVHCAGGLLRDYGAAPNGIERTAATHVLAPFELTWRLAPSLRAAGGAIVTLTSGGMYAARFDLDELVLPADDYDGVRAYARAKRAQVVLSHAWARRWGCDAVASYAVHPGWVDTPGLRSGLPSFAHLGPALRRPEEGADTAVWLVAGGARTTGPPTGPRSVMEGLWLDRRRRGEHYLPSTRPADPAADEERLWAWCAERTGVGLPGPEPSTGAPPAPSPEGGTR